MVLKEVVEWVGEICRVAYRSAYLAIKQRVYLFQVITVILFPFHVLVHVVQSEK
jgi:hypothetical protein